MAQARLERVGTIYTRIQSLMRGNAMRPEDRPIWYPIYEAFPPKVEPTFQMPVYDIQIKPILYEEDVVRAKLHKLCRNEFPAINLKKTHTGLVGHFAKLERSKKQTADKSPEEAEEAVLKEMSQSLRQMSSL